MSNTYHHRPTHIFKRPRCANLLREWHGARADRMPMRDIDSLVRSGGWDDELVSSWRSDRVEKGRPKVSRLTDRRQQRRYKEQLKNE